MPKRAKWSIRLPLVFVGSMVVAFLTSISPAYAYKVSGGAKWPNKSTDYNIDASYSNQGPGWFNTATGAAGDWNNVSIPGYPNPLMTFFRLGGSNNHFQAADLRNDSRCVSPSGTCAAITIRSKDIWGNITQFTTIVNVGSGFAFYDGTQAPSLPSNYADLRTVLRHELGHALGLCHSSGANLLMSTSMSAGVIRTIDQDAKNGDAYLYQNGYSGPAPEGGCS